MDGTVQDLAAGYTSGKLLLKLEFTSYILQHHTAEHFAFLDDPANSRSRTTFYFTLARLLFVEDTAAKFKAFVAPLQQATPATLEVPLTMLLPPQQSYHTPMAAPGCCKHMIERDRLCSRPPSGGPQASTPRRHVEAVRRGHRRMRAQNAGLTDDGCRCWWASGRPATVARTRARCGPRCSGRWSSGCSGTCAASPWPPTAAATTVRSLMHPCTHVYDVPWGVVPLHLYLRTSCLSRYADGCAYVPVKLDVNHLLGCCLLDHLSVFLRPCQSCSIFTSADQLAEPGSGIASAACRAAV